MPSIFARQLRADATDAEIRLGAKLRRKQLDGFRFRRQQPMGRYIVDFFCPEAGLIVEVDGGQHADESPARAAWLKSRGYCVMRFWNNEVLANTEGVVETIRGGGVAWSGSPSHDPANRSSRLAPPGSIAKSDRTGRASPSRGEGVLRKRGARSETSRDVARPNKEIPSPLEGEG
jgi:very-short-patch-repair endonuclease